MNAREPRSPELRPEKAATRARLRARKARVRSTLGYQCVDRTDAILSLQVTNTNSRRNLLLFLAQHRAQRSTGLGVSVRESTVLAFQ